MNPLKNLMERQLWEKSSGFRVTVLHTARLDQGLSCEYGDEGEGWESLSLINTVTHITTIVWTRRVS